MSLAAKLIYAICEGEASYLIREMTPEHGAVASFEVAKFAGSKEPSVVYRVSKTPRGWKCDCPSSFKSAMCKHCVLVDKWLKRGKPDPLSPGFQDWVASIID